MFGKNSSLTEPESTKTCTSRYTDFQVLPVRILMYLGNLNLSMDNSRNLTPIRRIVHHENSGQIFIQIIRIIDISEVKNA